MLQVQPAHSPQETDSRNKQSCVEMQQSNHVRSVGSTMCGLTRALRSDNSVSRSRNLPCYRILEFLSCGSIEAATNGQTICSNKIGYLLVNSFHITSMIDATHEEISLVTWNARFHTFWRRGHGCGGSDFGASVEANAKIPGKFFGHPLIYITILISCLLIRHYFERRHQILAAINSTGSYGNHRNFPINRFRYNETLASRNILFIHIGIASQYGLGPNWNCAAVT